MAFTWSNIVYAARLIEQLKTKLVFGAIAGRVQYIGSPVRGGSVQILTPGAVTIGTDAAADISFNAANAGPTSINITSAATFDESITLSNQQAMSDAQEQAWVDATIAQGTWGMAQKIDAALAALASDADLTDTFGTALSASNILDCIGTVRDNLEAAGALNNGAWIVFPSAFGGFLFNALGARPGMTDGVIRDGLLTRFMGCDIYTSPELTSGATPVHTLMAGGYGSIAAAYGIEQLNYGPLWPVSRGYGISGAVVYGVVTSQPAALFSATITK